MMIVGQQCVHVPPRVDRAPRVGFVHLAEPLGDVGREQDSEVESAVTNVDVRRSDGRADPVDYSGQSLARPEHVEVLIIAMDETRVGRRTLLGDERDGLSPDVGS